MEPWVARPIPNATIPCSQSGVLNTRSVPVVGVVGLINGRGYNRLIRGNLYQ